MNRMVCNKIGMSLITLLALFLLAGSAGAAPSEEWNKTFGGSGDDIANSVQQTLDGGYVVAGYTNSYGAGEDDAWLIKTDGNGNEVWNRTFGGASYDRALSVQQTSDDGYILAGETYSYGDSKGNAWLIKTYGKGNEQWNKTLEGKRASYIQQTSDGGYMIAGESLLTPPTIWLINTDNNGNEQWNRTFVSGKGNWAHSIRQTSDDGYIVAGDVIVQWGAAALLIKINTGGIPQWSNTFVGKGCIKDCTEDNIVLPLTGSTGSNAVQQTSDGGYVIAGYSTSYKELESHNGFLSNHDASLMKTDENGIEQWTKTFGGEDEDGASSVWQTSDMGYIIAGYTFPPSDIWLIKTDAKGNEQIKLWNKTFEGIEREMFTSIQQTRDGGFIIAGTTNSYGSGGSDAWLIKVGVASIEIAEAPTGSPTEKLAASPTQVQNAVPTETNTLKSLEKAAGFEAALSMMILLAAYTARRKKRQSRG